MCLAVYVASDVPLPLVAWQKRRPAFFVSDSIAQPDAVRAHVWNAHIYYAGTHEGCGCGFIRDGVLGGTPEHAAVSAVYHALADYLRQHAGGLVEIYTCWAGDEALGPQSTRAIGLSALYDERFEFAERERIAVDVGG